MKRGFTLVEIMIVVSIISLLAAIAIPNLLRAKLTTNEASAQVTLRAISTAAEMYSSSNNGLYPDDITDLISPIPPYINENYVATSPRQGYNFTFSSDAAGYTATATPASCHTTGNRIYNVTTGAVLNSEECS
jgi:type IV pilus assembly protein PilA